MDHGKDISHKIRSAIKAKLIELNAYVDDELPDYIMVMIANKKTEKQMNSDLNLFLSHNTEKFTSWLHILLKKLQSLGSDQQKSKELEKAEAKDNDPQKETHVDKKERQSKRQLSTEKKEKTKEKNKDSREKTKEVRSVAKEGKKGKAGPEVDPEIEDLLTNKEEDEFAAEFKEEPSVSKTGKAKPSDKNASSQDKQKASQVSSHSKAKSVVKPISVHSRLGLPLSPDKDRRTSSRSSPPETGRTVQRPSSSSSSKRTVTPPRRRQPTSVVASVKRKFELEEEEEYDPYNPAVGSVASVVQVSSRPRKSSVPITKQANKSLILKATAEAEKSVSMAMNSVLKEEKMYSAKEDARTKLRKPVTVTLHGRSGSSGVESRKPSTAGKARELVSNSKKTELMKNMKYTIENKPKPQKVQEVPRVIPVVDSRYIEIQDKTEDGDSVNSSSNTSQQLPVGSDDDRSVSPDLDPDVQQLLQQESERELSQGSPEVGEPEGSSPEVVEGEEGADIDEDDDVSQRALLLKQQSLQKNRKRTLAQTKTQKPTAFVAPVDTRFIVTLDGVNPDRFEADKEVGGGDMEVSNEIPKKANLHSAPEVKPITFSLKDTDDEEEEEVLPSKAAKLSEKCRFWPACVNGNACLYHHPTMPCKMFPQCKFGDKCLYIHPNCKFDAQCTRKECPFTHASKRNTSTTVIQKIVQVPVPVAASYGSSFNKGAPTNTPITCRFFPNCSNVQCTFYHPKPCRFGIKCMNKPTCSFYHPSVPSKSQLTWTSSSKQSSRHISQRQFDAGAAESLPVSVD